MKAVARNRRQVYKMRPIIDAVVDKLVLRDGREFGRSIIAGLARLEGACCCSQRPLSLCGSWTADACQKVVRYATSPRPSSAGGLSDGLSGFMIGLDAEKAATIPSRRARDGRRQPDTVPWCTIIVRNAFGVAGVVHQPRPVTRCATPGRRPMGFAALEAASRRLSRRHRRRRRSESKLGEIEDRLNKRVRRFVRLNGSGSRRSSIPRKTRSLLCEFARLAEPIRAPGPRPA